MHDCCKEENHGVYLFSLLILLLQMAGDKADAIATVIEEAGGECDSQPCFSKSMLLILQDDMLELEEHAL